MVRDELSLKASRCSQSMWNPASLCPWWRLEHTHNSFQIWFLSKWCPLKLHLSTPNDPQLLGEMGSCWVCFPSWPILHHKYSWCCALDTHGQSGSISVSSPQLGLTSFAYYLTSESWLSSAMLFIFYTFVALWEAQKKTWCVKRNI